ncbi:alpha/beta fold hydrolase [Aquabacterium sp. OR-4]|uniref:alpha/beta fold hydrolase n=1 Tax=Aquabacterium sp. OR-4 TaxID=2978127 RepID=UPI0028C64BB8|nr:alpha/beta fold hydrolase [Aquabacterium sp. OR-4]MDT7838569.1 alpha/beta fold hydrolase [Aquabacterium sp. OR-4]
MAAPQELFARQLADGPGVPVVFSHALGLDHAMWQGTAQALDGRHPVLAYDHRGHGRSPGYAAAPRMQTLVDDAAQVVEAWGRGPVVFVGLSMGGMVGQGLAIQRPDLVAGLVLAHTTAVYPPAAREAWAQRVATVRAGGMAAVVELVLSRYLSPAFIQQAPPAAAQLRRQILAADPAGYAASCEAIAAVDWLDQLPGITCPTLVLAGALDLGAPPAMAEEIQQRVPGATLSVLADAAHLSPVEQPAAFQQALRDFLDARAA